MSVKVEEEYLYRLSSLDGNDFQLEIEKILQDTFLDFQPTPANPGDGGSDGLINGNTAICCCYGLDLKKGNLTPKKIVEKIHGKFTLDFLRLLELEVHTNKDTKTKTYKHKPNKELKSILVNKKIKVIHATTNFDNLSLIGTLNATLNELKKHSQLNFIEQSCTVVYRGPKGLRSFCHITNDAVSRLKFKKFNELIELALNDNRVDNIDRAVTGLEFDDKFDDLLRQRGTSVDKIAAINKYREDNFKKWCEHIIFYQKLEKDAPNVYKKAIEASDKIAKEMEISRALETVQVNPLIKEFDEKIRQKWLKILLNYSPAKLDEVIEMDRAHFIGTCPLDWRNR